MTLAEMWREEGREEGLKKGLEMGQAQALSSTAITLLNNRFGAVPEDLKTAILKANVPTLQLTLTNIFNIETIEEVQQYLH